MEFEIKIIEFLQANASVTWIRVFSILTMLGGVLGAVIASILVWKRSKGMAVVLFVTFLCASLINYILKIIISRPRPFEVSNNILNLGNESGYSFPSGHSVGAGVIVTFLLYALVSSGQGKGTKIAGGIAICLYPFLIAFTRMVLGVHYLTDTLAGILVGVAVGLCGIYFYKSLAKKIEVWKREGDSYDE